MNTIPDTINEILLGGLLGILGQGIRIAVGLKKLNNSNVTNTLNNQDTDEFSTSRLLVSIFIGFAAGAIALLLKGAPTAIDKEFIISMMAAGYAGADFIEGVFKTYVSKIDPKNQPGSDKQPEKVADESTSGNSQAKG
jgi:hypothetical protein